MAHRPQQNGVAWLEQIDRALRHHASPPEEMLRAPLEVLISEPRPVPRRRAIQHALCLWNHLGADTVAGNHRDRECFHRAETIFARGYFGLFCALAQSSSGLRPSAALAIS